MRATPVWLGLPIALVVLALPGGLRGQAPFAPPGQAPNPYPYEPDELIAKELSLAKSAEYLDGVARFWMRPNSCGACHANFAYLMARPLLGGRPTPLLAQTRHFLEQRKKTTRFSFDAEAVAIAFALAWDDVRNADKLRPATRHALSRIWPLQKPYGAWNSMGCGTTVPAENDRHYTASLAALAVGMAPERYVYSAEAQPGLTRLRGYFQKVPARTLHDRALLLWASLHVSGLMTPAQRRQTVQSLLAAQKQDGGWSLGELGEEPHVPASPSDGYGTGFVIFVLRQAGVPAGRPELVRGVGWLRRNQRASGRWFTPSPAAGDRTEGGVGTRDLYVQNLGTAFAVLALKACEGRQRSATVEEGLLLRATPGLALRHRLISD
jgi:squalene-hopene/tetraprenyl-beta-curcumene cyclase